MTPRHRERRPLRDRESTSSSVSLSIYIYPNLIVYEQSRSRARSCSLPTVCPAYGEDIYIPIVCWEKIDLIRIHARIVSMRFRSYFFIRADRLIARNIVPIVGLRRPTWLVPPRRPSSPPRPTKSFFFCRDHVGPLSELPGRVRGAFLADSFLF